VCPTRVRLDGCLGRPSRSPAASGVGEAGAQDAGGGGWATRSTSRHTPHTIPLTRHVERSHNQRAQRERWAAGGGSGGEGGDGAWGGGHHSTVRWGIGGDGTGGRHPSPAHRRIPAYHASAAGQDEGVGWGPRARPQRIGLRDQPDLPHWPTPGPGGQGARGGDLRQQPSQCQIRANPQNWNRTSRI